MAKLLLIVADVHGGAGQHIGRPYQDREADLLDELVDIFQRRQFLPARLVHFQLVDNARELVAVFRPVDVFRPGPQDRNAAVGKPQCQVVRDLTADGDHDAVRILHLHDVHDTLVGQFVEIQAVAHVIIGRDRFRVVIDHNAPVTLFLDGLQAGYRAPVEFDRTADAIGTRTEHDDRTPVVLVMDVVV